jgi:hypothetical protein
MKTALLILLMVSACECTRAQDNRVRRDRVSAPLAAYIRSLTPAGPSLAPRKAVLVFFLRFVDFGCEVCLNNFLDFCDTLNSSVSRYGFRNIIMVFQRDDNEEGYQMKTTRKWSRACNLHYPIYLAPSELFEENDIEYSTAMFLNDSDVIELSGQVPLPVEVQNEFIEKLFR